jgi:two-component system response regulator AtoC
MESELFGFEKGAFTSATARKIGLCELAGSGTLFLDEIGEMPLRMQVKLLRVLQDRRVRRLGGTRDIPLGARIVSATNRDLEAEVRAGRFREDLFYRLNVLRIEAPPLRDRLSDLGILCAELLERTHTRARGSSGTGGAALSVGADALAKLSRYGFPGNIRELENILERAAIYAETDTIRARDIDIRESALPGAFSADAVRPAAAATAPRAPAADPAAAHPAAAGSASAGSIPTAAPPTRSPDGARSLKESGRELIAAALERNGGNRTKAATELGISRRTILYKIKEYDL